MQGPPGGGGWNPGGGPPGGTPPPSQPGAPARTVALSAAELQSAQGATPPPTAGPHGAPAAGYGAAGYGAPPAGYGTPPAQVFAQPVEARQLPTNVGLFVGLAFFALGTLSCLGTGAAAAVLREPDAVMVSYLTVPMIFGGLVAPIVGLITRGQSAPVSGGASAGCGCLTMMTAVVAVVAFYQLIWPSL